MTRVLVVDDATGLWGAQRWVERVGSLLADHGIDVVVAAPEGAELAAAWAAAGGEVVARLHEPARSIRAGDGDLAAGPLAREVVRSAANARRLAAIARARRIDVLVGNAHWTHLEVGIASALARVPAALVLHEECRGGMAAHLRGVTVGLTRAAIAVSNAVADGVPRAWRRRVVVVPNGVDVASWRPAPADPAVRVELAARVDAPVVLALSRLDRHKGVDDAMRAVAATPPELGMQLAIAGAPSLDPGWDAELRALGEGLLGDRVRFLGERRDAAALLHAADALVLASSVEGMPLSILEAQACGTPVVAYDTGGVGEIVAHQRTGFIARRGDVDALAAGLVAAVTDGPARDALVGDARHAVVVAHDLTHQAKAVAAVLHDLAGARR